MLFAVLTPLSPAPPIPNPTSEMQSQGKNFVTDPNPPEGAQISHRPLP